MTLGNALWAGAMLLMVGCTLQNSTPDPNTVDFNSAMNGELSRCEATGRTREKCCDDHDIDPCPSVALNVDPALLGPPVIVVRR